MSKLYLRKRGDHYIEVDPAIIRWRKKAIPIQPILENKSKLGRPKVTSRKPKIRNFF